MILFLQRTRNIHLLVVLSRGHGHCGAEDPKGFGVCSLEHGTKLVAPHVYDSHFAIVLCLRPCFTIEIRSEPHGDWKPNFGRCVTSPPASSKFPCSSQWKHVYEVQKETG